MYLIKGGPTESGGMIHVFVEMAPPPTLPAGCAVLHGVTLNTYPPPTDPDAPTFRVALYRDPATPTRYHYMLPPALAKQMKRVSGLAYVYLNWEEFARQHPTVVAEMGG
jgi:hypothetical protein